LLSVLQFHQPQPTYVQGREQIIKFYVTLINITLFLYLKKTNVWYHFRDFEEDEGWIHESLVNKTPTVITNSATANIRSGPGTKNKILFTVDKGIPFKILKRKGKWIHIQHADGDKGWIHKTLVW